MVRVNRSVIILFSVPVFSAFTGISCRTDPKKAKEVTAVHDVRTEFAKSVEILYSDSGKLRVKIMAPELRRYYTGNPYNEMSGGITVYFYDDSMHISSKLTAGRCVTYEKEEKMRVQDNVVLLSAKGEKLNAEELIWDEKAGRVYSDKFVKITTPEEIVFGDGFEADQAFTRYKVKKIRGTITVQDNAAGG